MDDIKVDGKRQLTAAISLLERSLLVRWKNDRFVSRFKAGQEELFGSKWKRIDKVYGRLICWIHFSTGAEFLVKGVCLLNNIDFRTDKKPVPAYPMEGSDNLTTWAPKFLSNCEAKRMLVTAFGTLGKFVDKTGSGRAQETLPGS